MKTFKLLSIAIVLLFVNCGNADVDNNEIANNISAQEKNENTLKRYLVKSGIVKYKTSINGKVMGSNITGSGTEELYFKNWGDTELKKEDSKKVTHIDIFGQKKTDIQETHTINKLDNGKSYAVDMKNKTIYLRRDPAMEMMKSFNKGDAVNPGEEMLKSIGGKKVGKEKILGYLCDVWEVPGGKQWMYKGLPLKFVMTVMGITSSSVATSAEFNISVADKYFKLPDYPVQKEEGYLNDKDYKQDKAEMKENANKMSKMTFAQYKEMLKKSEPEDFKNMSEEELKIGYQMMQKMAKRLSK